MWLRRLGRPTWTKSWAKCGTSSLTRQAPSPATGCSSRSAPSSTQCMSEWGQKSEEFVCLFVSPSVRLSTHPSVQLSVQPSTRFLVCLFVCSYVRSFVRQPIHLPVHSSICLFICPTFHLFVCLFVCSIVQSSVHSSICLSVHPLFICLFVCLFVRSFVCPSVRLSIRPSVRSFVHVPAEYETTYKVNGEWFLLNRLLYCLRSVNVPAVMVYCIEVHSYLSSSMVPLQYCVFLHHTRAPWDTVYLFVLSTDQQTYLFHLICFPSRPYVRILYGKLGNFMYIM